jgi:hypothetical protein
MGTTGAKPWLLLFAVASTQGSWKPHAAPSGAAEAHDLRSVRCRSQPQMTGG